MVLTRRAPITRKVTCVTLKASLSPVIELLLRHAVRLLCRSRACNARACGGNITSVTGQKGRVDLPDTRAGDDTAWFGALFRAYHPVMVSAAYNRLNNRADAEEVAAEVFRIAWDRRQTLRETKRLAWLYSILRNVVGNEYRRRTRADKRSERAASELLAVPDLPKAASYLSDQLEVREAVAALSPGDRELIWMAYWEELTREEMAEVLDCSTASVRVQLHRARGRLKVVLHHLAHQSSGGAHHD